MQQQPTSSTSSSMITDKLVEQFLEREQGPTKLWFRDNIDSFVDFMFAELKVKFRRFVAVQSLMSNTNTSTTTTQNVGSFGESSYETTSSSSLIGNDNATHSQPRRQHHHQQQQQQQQQHSKHQNALSNPSRSSRQHHRRPGPTLLAHQPPHRSSAPSSLKQASPFYHQQQQQQQSWPNKKSKSMLLKFNDCADDCECSDHDMNDSKKSGQAVKYEEGEEDIFETNELQYNQSENHSVNDIADNDGTNNNNSNNNNNDEEEEDDDDDRFHHHLHGHDYAENEQYDNGEKHTNNSNNNNNNTGSSSSNNNNNNDNNNLDEFDGDCDEYGMDDMDDHEYEEDDENDYLVDDYLDVEIREEEEEDVSIADDNNDMNIAEYSVKSSGSKSDSSPSKAKQSKGLKRKRGRKPSTVGRSSAPAQEPMQIVAVKCYKCELMFESIDQLDSHLKAAHKIDKFRCYHKGCFGSFESKALLMKHSTTHRTSRWLCNECPNSIAYQSHEKLVQHTINSHHFGRFRCTYPECNTMVNRRQAIFAHYRVHRVLLCRFCGKHCPDITKLRQHENWHKNIEPFRCKWLACGYGSAFQSSIHNHVLKHFREAGIKSTRTLDYYEFDESMLRKTT